MNTQQLEKGTPQYLLLQEILIIGNSSEQVMICHLCIGTFLSVPKFSDCELDQLYNEIYKLKKGYFKNKY